ncbi:MAG: TIR domain-containing protein [Hyphococcus sp.]
MADIFISYARADRQRIEKLAAALEAEGYSVWWDREIAGGAEFSAVIEQELAAAKTVIVGWSAQSLGSHWVRDEADYARGENKMLPLSLDGSLPPLGFRQIHALDFSGWNGEASHAAFRDLCSALGSKAPAPADTATAGASAQQKPIVAVRPFTSLSSDAEIEFLADGVCEDIITSLSNYRQLAVPARATLFALKSRTTDAAEVAARLGARYIVDGSFRKIGSHIRISVQFVDAAGGAQLWAKKFDEALETLTDTPDAVADKIAGSIFAQFLRAETDRADAIAVGDRNEWALLLTAQSTHLVDFGSIESHWRAFELAKKATELSPNSGLAHAMASWAASAIRTNACYEDDQLDTINQDVIHHLEKARAFAGEDIMALIWLASAETYAGQMGRARRVGERVLERNPSSAEAWNMLSLTYAYLGEFEKAHHAIARASEISSEGGMAYIQNWYRGLVEHHAGNYERAAELNGEYATRWPRYGYANMVAAIDYASCGGRTRAQRFVKAIKQHTPTATPDKILASIRAQYDKEKGARESALFEDLWAEATG